MSPEQVRGDPVDGRTDIFSLGAVLYEMLSGTKAFPGRSFIEASHAILESDPAPLPESVPPWLGLVVGRCLEKEPARRFQSAADLAFALGATATPRSGAVFTLPRAPRAVWRRAVLVVAALATLAAVGTLWRPRLQREPAPSIPGIERLTFRAGAIGGARFTPDHRVAFSAPFEGRPEEVYSLVLGSPEPQLLGIQSARLAAVSRTTGELAVLLGSESVYLGAVRGTLARVAPTGGVPREIAENVAWAEWTPEGDLVVARREGARTWIEWPLGKTVWSGAGAITDFRCSPDGKQVAFVHHPLGSQTDIILLSPSKTPRVLLTSPAARGFVSTAVWRPDGKGLVFSSSTSAGSMLVELSLTGATRPLYRLPGVVWLQDIDSDGKLLVLMAGGRDHVAVLSPATHAFPRDLAWLSAPELGDLSPDGRKLLFSDSAHGQTYAVLRETDGKPAKVLGPGIAFALSPDGKTAALLPKEEDRLVLAPTGAGLAVEVAVPGLEVQGAQFSRNGRRLWIAAHHKDRAGSQLYPIDVASRRLLEPIPDSDVAPFTPIAVSPDDRWIAISGTGHVPTLIPTAGGEPTRITTVSPEFRPFPAGWSSDGALWLGFRSAKPARLVRVALPSQKITRTLDLELYEPGGYEIHDARISQDESLVVLEYPSFEGWLALIDGLALDR
jgi:hypothetical protein